MTRRMLCWVALAVVASLPAVTAAQEAKPIEPALVVQLNSVDGVLADLKYFAGLFNRTELTDQIDGLIPTWTGPNGLAESGIDTKRPFLAYAMPTAELQESRFAVMIPVADESAFLRLLEGIRLKSEKNSDGLYAVEYPNQPVKIYFRFANGYAYFSAIDRAHIDLPRLVAPETLTTTDSNLALAVTVRIDRVPDSVKQLALGQIELRLAEIKDRKSEGESPDQARTRRQGFDALSEAVKRVLSEGRALEFRWSVDRAKDEVAMSLSVDGKAGTAMGSIIGALNSGKTRFAPAAGSALHIGLNFALPEAIHPLLGFGIDSLTRDAVAKESDPTKREVTEKVVKAIAPTLKAGQVDLHIAAGAPAGSRFNLLAALGVRKGKAIEEAVKSLVGQMPESQRSNISLDNTKVGDLSVHRLTIDEKAIDANGKRILGPNASLWAGFHPNAVMVGVGGDPTEAFGRLVSAEPTACPLLVIEGSIGRLSGLDPHPAAAKLAAEVFGNDTSADTFRLSLEGGAKLKLTAAFRGKGLRFITLLNERKGENSSP